MSTIDHFYVASDGSTEALSEDESTDLNKFYKDFTEASEAMSSSAIGSDEHDHQTRRRQALLRMLFKRCNTLSRSGRPYQIPADLSGVMQDELLTETDSLDKALHWSHYETTFATRYGMAGFQKKRRGRGRRSGGGGSGRG